MTSSTDIGTIWYSHCGYSPLAVAIQQGWLQAELAPDGIELKSVKRDGNRAEKLSHYDHHLPNSIRQGGSVPAIWARARGGETRLIGLNWLNEYQAVIALPASGIKSVRDLRGRRLALPSGRHPVDHMRAANLRGFSIALELAGLNHKTDVEFVLQQDTNSDFGGRAADEDASPVRTESLSVNALLNGQVNAIFVRGGHGVEITDALRAQVVLDISAHPDPLVRANNGGPRPLTVDAGFLERRPDLVARILARVAAVGPWAEAHPVETVSFIARQGGVSIDATQRAYNGNLQNMLHTTLDENALSSIEAYKNFLLEAGFLDHDFDIRAWAAPETLTSLSRRENRLVA